MPKTKQVVSEPAELTDEDITPTSARQVEDGKIEYFFPRQQKTVFADSLAEAQELLKQELAKDNDK